MRRAEIRDNPLVRIITGAFAISFSGVWVKFADVSPASSAFYRVFFGFLFFFLFSIITREKGRWEAKYIWLGFICGAFFVFDLLCWHTAIGFVGPGLATLIGNFQVFILAAAGILFFKERYSPGLLLAIPLAISGLYLVIGLDWPQMTDGYRRGIYLGLATALFYAAYLLSLKRLSSGASNSFAPMMLVSFASSIILAIYIFCSMETFSIPDSRSVTSLLCLGLFSQFFGWFLIATSLPRLNTSFAGLMLLLQPSLAFVWDVLLFDRPTTLLNWTGVALALCAIYLGITSKRL